MTSLYIYLSEVVDHKWSLQETTGNIMLPKPCKIFAKSLKNL